MRLPLDIEGTSFAEPLLAHVNKRASWALESGRNRLQLLSNSAEVATGYSEYYLATTLPTLANSTLGITDQSASAAALTSAALLDVGGFAADDRSPVVTCLTQASWSRLARALLAAIIRSLLRSPPLVTHMDQPCGFFTDAVSFGRHLTRPETHRDHLRLMCQQLAALLAPSNVDTPLGLYQAALHDARTILRDLAHADATRELNTPAALAAMRAEVLAEARYQLEGEFLLTADKFRSDVYAQLQEQARAEVSAEVLAWQTQYKASRLATAQAETDAALVASTLPAAVTSMTWSPDNHMMLVLVALPALHLSPVCAAPCSRTPTGVVLPALPLVAPSSPVDRAMYDPPTAAPPPPSAAVNAFNNIKLWAGLLCPSP
ncbi:hypothetical protein B0F90DRAFT_1670890 [Multifurca ochricompacta]|uniref:Uncharacterized protein n=1 Tax=Multifurca ochricompacta TaxID=376703 RepID=A0AAD4LWJ8_9AGAM|nr:hypothetical protein B0F90DRAFT_1670890 [Multifurca ochricompacta]